MFNLESILKRTARLGLRSLPPRLRLFSDVAMGGLSDIYANWHLPAHLVRGRLLEAKSEGSLIYFGQLPQYKSWIANFFSDSMAPESIGNFSLPDISRRKGLLSYGDVLVCPTTPLSLLLFKKRGWLVVPKYVECEIDLRTPLDQLIRRHAAKDDLRIIRKKNYRFEVLHDDATFNEFYHEMLVPTTRIRHEERANISTLEALRTVFHQGYLLAAYQGSEWVGANLIVPQANNRLNWANIGWRDGSEQMMKDRLVSALLYEMIQRGQNEGFTTLNLGSCSPFVNDGPLNYKLKWGAQMAAPQLSYECDQLQGLNAYFAAHFKLASDSAKLMLKHAPILDRHDGRLRAVGWSSKLRPDFKHQVDGGLPWTDLSN
jgi:hypothetical protein